MTAVAQVERQAFARFLNGAGDKRLIVLHARAGAGLTPLLDDLRGTAPPSARLLDDAQRRPAALRTALEHLRRNPAARLLAGVDLDDDHPSRVTVTDGLDSELAEVGVQRALAFPAEQSLATMVRDVAPETDPAVTAAFVQRAGRAPATLRHLLTLPQVQRRLRDGRLLMHPEEIAGLPVEGSDALRTRWVGLTVPERQLVVAVWVAGGRVSDTQLRAHLRQAGWPEVAVAAAPPRWLTEDDDELWLGKRVLGLLESLRRDAPLVHDVREVLRDFVLRPKSPPEGHPRPVLDASATPQAEHKPQAQPQAQGAPKAKPQSHGRPNAKPHGKANAKPHGKANAKPHGKANAKPQGKANAKPQAHGKPNAKPQGQDRPNAKPQPQGRPNAKPPARARTSAKPRPPSAPTSQPSAELQKSEAALFKQAREAEARGDFSAAERTHRERVLLFMRTCGPTNGQTFGARRQLVACLLRADERDTAVKELASLAKDSEAARGPNSPLVCDILLDYGLRGIEAGDPRGLERANDALRRFKAIGREDMVTAGARKLHHAKKLAGRRGNSS